MRNFIKNKPRPTWDAFVSWGLRIGTVAILSGLSILAYWVFIDRMIPVTVHHGEVTGFEHQPDDSWIMLVKWHGVRHRQCWGLSKRWISGDFVLPLPDIPYPPDRPAQQLGPFTWEVPIHIPPYYVSTGHAQGQYSIRIFYACNPMQRLIFPIVVEPDPIKFVIPTDMPMKRVQTGEIKTIRPTERKEPP